jgi:hypothetical protein
LDKPAERLHPAAEEQWDVPGTPVDSRWAEWARVTVLHPKFPEVELAEEQWDAPGTPVDNKSVASAKVTARRPKSLVAVPEAVSVAESDLRRLPEGEWFLRKPRQTLALKF